MLTDHLVSSEIYFESLEKEKKIRDNSNSDFFNMKVEIIKKYLASIKGLKAL